MAFISTHPRIPSAPRRVSAMPDLPPGRAFWLRQSHQTRSARSSASHRNEVPNAPPRSGMAQTRLKALNKVKER